MTLATGHPFGALWCLTVQVMGGDQLVPTPDAAKALGISPRTIQRYVAAGLITPDLTLPSGKYRWDVKRLREQINAIPREREQPPAE